MKNAFSKAVWNPYIAGALVGILAISSVVISTKVLGKPQYLGASTTFVRAAGLIEKTFVGEHVAKNDYYQAEKVKVDWQMLFVFGILLGALISSSISKDFKLEKIPPLWKDFFGEKISVRASWAIIGGIVSIFGARLAGGCPSGHGMSGMMQLAISSLIAMLCFLIGGIITAQLLYKRRS
ncbi:MAG: YeeE/YedE thiosulfate transporter family protein [Candidatus Omnitrophota bacterium]